MPKLLTVCVATDPVVTWT